MNIRAYTFTGAFMMLVAGLAMSRLFAQTTFSIPFTAAQTSPAATFTIDAFGTLSETAPASTSATFTFTNTPQMVWLPALGAFRAGSFSGSQTFIGQYSAAFGPSSASGSFSFAAGLGAGAGGYNSVSFGAYTNASGASSLAAGFESVAAGGGSVAFGSSTMASGNNSFALGSQTTAAAYNSTATGANTTANSYGSFVIGQYNMGLSSIGAKPNPNAWVSTDPLFEIGNGNGAGYLPNSDALVVYKNGNATLQGVLTAAPGGDIRMYSGQ